jgi:hypothetical protein
MPRVALVIANQGAFRAPSISCTRAVRRGFLAAGRSAGLSAWLAAQTGFAMPVGIGAAEVALLGGLLLAGAVIAALPAWLAFRRPIAEGLSA